MNLFYQPLLPETNFLDLEESKHCIKVLRNKEGDTIHIVDGKGTLYEAVITNPSHKRCEFKVLKTEQGQQNKIYRHIAIAPTKNIDRIEWFVEKAVEIGIDEISFIICDHSERSVLKMDRIEKKAVSAMKQSLKYSMPSLNECIKVRDLINTDFKNYVKTIAFVDFNNPLQLGDISMDQHKILCLIGPEGDFSDHEVKEAMDKGYQKVALGSSRLRTETAGIIACHLMNLF